MNDLPIALRPAHKEDVNFIFNAWLKSFRNSDFATPMANEIYFSNHHKTIEKILKYYSVIIACNKDDPNQIYGFLCAGYTDSVFTIHYAYVKHPFRKMGIAKELLKSFNYDPNYAAIYTHDSKIAKYLVKNHNIIYHPYIALDPEAYIKSKDKK